MTAPSDLDVQAWARRELGVAREATAAELRIAALKLIGGAGGMPTLDDSVAIGVALGRPRETVEAFMQEAYFSRDEDALGRGIDEFSRDFFTIPRSERVKRWSELHHRAGAFPWWRGRLLHLKKGLDVERPEHAPGRLAEMTLELFVLPATERAARRREMVASLRSNPISSDEVSAFKTAHPNIAALAGNLIDDLRYAPPRSTARIAAPERTAKTGGSYSRSPAPAPSSSANGWPVWTIGVAVLIAIRILVSVGSSSRPAPQPAFQQNRPNDQFNRNVDFKGLDKAIEDIRKRREAGEDVPMGEATRRLLGIKDEPKK